MSQQRLASLLWVTQQTISVWELGRDHHGAPVSLPGDLEAKLEAIERMRGQDNENQHEGSRT